jgi:hypothetical protein
MSCWYSRYATLNASLVNRPGMPFSTKLLWLLSVGRLCDARTAAGGKNCF